MGFGIRYATSSPYWQYYYFGKNIQGDVIALYRSDYNSSSQSYYPTLVATYSYDPWGTPTGIYDANGNSISQTAYHVAAYNPFRYRGYRYDGDTRLYYLQSRYYDPAVGRFINADKYAGTGQGYLGYNMFAYCQNNPVALKDPSGSLAIIAIIAAAAMIATLSACSTATSKNKSPAPSDYRNYSGGRGAYQHNCYSYAFNLPAVADPGDYAKKCRQMDKPADAMYGGKQFYTVQEVADFVLADAREFQRKVRTINSPSDITNSEYCVALKVTTDTSYGSTMYHFMYQLSNGQWAEKYGDKKSEYGVRSGTDASWTYQDTVYDSETIFFAVPIS